VHCRRSLSHAVIALDRSISVIFLQLIIHLDAEYNRTVRPQLSTSAARRGAAGPVSVAFINLVSILRRFSAGEQTIKRSRKWRTVDERKQRSSII